MNDDVAVKVEGVYKNFRLPHEKVTSIKSFFTGLSKKRTRTFEVQHALEDISFEVKKGEFFGIVGRNGSGKSTLLKIIAEIYRPTKGILQKSGKLVPFIELGVGFNPELTGRENVYLNGALLGFTTKEIDALYDDIVEFAELELFMDQKLKNYSSGMQVRLAFSVATRAKADILLIDEVLAVGDADFQRKCFEYFQRIKSKGITVVFVTHDMGAVRQYCDRAMLIDKSKQVYIGDAETAAKKYTRLFAHDGSQHTESGEKKERWGNSKATFKDATAEVINDGKDVLVTATVTATAEIQDPTYGFMIANEARQPILGTNSNIIQAETKPLDDQSNFTIEWQFPNVFNEGRFQVELVLMYDAVTEVADWWEGAAWFSVRNDMKTPYIVNPPTKFTYKDNHDK